MNEEGRAAHRLRRSAGAAVHVASLPGPHGSGDLGAGAWRFVDWLAEAGLSMWQMLPLAPVGYGNSPYQALSAFAGEPACVALAPLVERGWLPHAALADAPAFDDSAVDYGRVVPWRLERLALAFEGFEQRAAAEDRRAFEAWCARHAAWLDDAALFLALKRAHGGQPWWLWDAALAHREPAALARARDVHARALRRETFVQWCFDEQLRALRAHAAARGVRLMGDLPLFIAHDSADVWARPDLFHLGPDLQPTLVAGVPPDNYSADGQRWGNPLYRWDRMRAEGFGWWVRRLLRQLEGADLVRIDHFRGLAACWEIPAACPTARDGRWVEAPGHELIEALARALGAAPGQEAAFALPLVAEDLGLITPDVTALRDRFGLPGMRIVYESFIYGPDHAFAPHHHVPHMLAYTSTPDSDTVRGWWQGATPAQRALAAACLGLDAHDADAPVHEALLRATFSSVADTALATVQDLIGLGSDARLNRPGTASGNWAWRVPGERLDAALAARIAALVRATARRVG